MERRTILKAAAATAALFAAAPSLLARESAGLRPASFPLDPALSPLAQAARDGSQQRRRDHDDLPPAANGP